MKINYKILCILVSATILTTSVIYNVGISNKAKADEFQPLTEGQIIRDKMLNSVDNFGYSKGSFTYTIASGDSTQVQFEVQEGTNPGSHIQIKDIVKSGTFLLNKVSDGKTILVKDETNKSYQKDNVHQPQAIVGSRKIVNEDKTATFLYRQDPATATLADRVVFPQEVAFWLDDNEGNFNVVRHENMLGRDATVIEGTIPKGMIDRAKSFTVWVDSDTGILLGLEATQADGTPYTSIIVHDIVIKSQKEHLKTAPIVFDTTEPAVGYTKIERSILKK
jgi:hypothetical protein